MQICQHHCPVSHVAEEFPELCAAELEAFRELLGTHVQRLATIANGDCACTTHVPLFLPSGDPGQKRAGTMNDRAGTTNDRAGTTNARKAAAQPAAATTIDSGRSAE